jgi:hypothetical protein
MMAFFRDVILMGCISVSCLKIVGLCRGGVQLRKSWPGEDEFKV